MPPDTRILQFSENIEQISALFSGWHQFSEKKQRNTLDLKIDLYVAL